jgi:hypothetical protein
MLIQNLYDKDITRRINPAVVVSEMDEYSIKQEIDEYVFTTGITKSIYKFLNAVANQKEGKTGIWISGYYGSGKSHFIKYLFYCLNEKYRDRAFSNFEESVRKIDPLEEPNPGLVSNLKKKLSTITVDEIIFNIDYVSKQKDNENQRITGIFLNKLNEFRGFCKSNPALAIYLEKPLAEKGVFDTFKAKIKSHFNETWDGNQGRFARRYLDKVISIAQEFDADIDKETLKVSILDKNQDYTIDFLIDELKDFLSDKDDNYRLLFLIDEVSQYIGSNTSLLLNLQTIIEEIGSQIGNKVWIVCTAQQDLSHLIDNTDDKTEDFGKILGRFETMISLESQDAAYITKKRVLDKKSEGIGVLNDFYKKNRGGIENQFVFEHDLYQNFKDFEDFTLTYPFVPYQFRLISDVFESFSNVGYVGEGVKNTERAILGITHFTANRCKDDEVGYFVPFDLFFNEQLEKHLTHHARGILDRAYNIEQVKADQFAKRVVNVLFMISNLGESQSVNFPANLENMALLLMESVDTPKLEMQNEVQRVLDILAGKKIIQASEGKYRFLKEDEIEVAHIIKSTAVTSDDKWKYIYEDIILKVVKPSPIFNPQGFNRTFRAAISVDDKEFGAKGDFNLKFSFYDYSDFENLAHKIPSNDILIGINEWFRDDEDLKSKILDYVRTQIFIRNNKASAKGTRNQTINTFGENNKILLIEINQRFERKFLQTAIISNNQIVRPDELSGNTPFTRFEDMIKRHMESIYRKHKISNGYASSNAELISHAKEKQKKAFKNLEPAEEEMNTKLTLMGEAPVVGDVVKEFDKPPYGWKDLATLDILLQLAKKGHRRFEWRNEEIDLVTFAEKALNSRERDAISIFKEKAHSQEEVNELIHVVNNEIFAETMIPSDTSDFKEAVESFKKKLEPKLVTLNRLKEEYEVYSFSWHLKKYHQMLRDLYNSRNPDLMVKQILEAKEQIKQTRDIYMYAEEFIEHHFKSYEQIVQFAELNKNNFGSLDEIYSVKADELSEYLKTDKEPWDNFPQMRKAYKELNDAIKEKVELLKGEAIQTYEKIFDEIEKHRQELSIKEENITTCASYYLEKIKKEKQITQLEIYQLKANDFRAENFKRLDDFKAEQESKQKGEKYFTSVTISVASEMEPTTIETVEQLDEYLKKLRERLMVKLSKNKKIFLN